MSIISRIESIKNELSNSEKKLFHFIKKNPEKVPSMTANELAKATGISAPTVVRFARKTGFSSLTELKIQLSAESGQHQSDIIGYTDVEPNEPFSGIKSKLSHNAQVTLSETADLLDEAAFTATVKLLEKKERIYVIGIGASGLIAQDIQHKWTRLGKVVVFENDYNLLLPQLIKHEKESVLWAISNTGNSPEMVHLAEYVRKRKIPTISLTRFGSNALAKSTNISLQVSRSRETDFRSAATNSIIAHLLAVDIVFYLFLSRNQELAENIYLSRKSIDEFRRNYL